MHRYYFPLLKYIHGRRWRSSLVALAKDASNSMERYEFLAGRVNTANVDVNEDNDNGSNNTNSNNSNHSTISNNLNLAAAATRLLSVHVNAWSLTKISCELERIWLAAVRNEAKRNNPRLQRALEEWCAVDEQLNSCMTASANSKQKNIDADKDAVERVHECQTRIGECRAEVKRRAERLQESRERNLREELRYLERKVAPLATPIKMAARSVISVEGNTLTL